MRILVTGHRGYIGSVLYRCLEGMPFGIDIKDGLDPENDIVTFKNLAKNQYDVIIHTAAKVSVVNSVANPYEDALVNVVGTVNLLKLFPKAKFVYLSTSCLYGEGFNHTEDSPIKPESPYALSKYIGEKYIQLLSKNPLILRLGNVIGEGYRGEPNVYQIFAREKELTIYGDGLQTRDFVQIATVCGAVEKGIKNNVSGIFNIGTGTSKTVLEVAKEFKKPYRFAPARRGEIHDFSLNVEKARKAGLLW